MSEFIVTARKWRPLRFEDVVGQDHVTTTLRNAIRGDRVAHAYLFSGPRGVGKTTTARLLAKVVNCLNPVDLNPDNECEICTEIAGGRSFNVLEIDGASSRGVDDIRSLREAVRYAPAKGKYKTYIVDEVHMLTKEAFNALLKTLEEPPKHVLFILATTEIHKVPATVLSRCQRFDFRRLTVDEIVGNLTGIAAADGITIENEALILIALKADGSLRDAQSLFDQMVSLCGKRVTYEQIRNELRVVDAQMYFQTTDAIAGHDSGRVLQIVDSVISQGFDLKEFIEGLNEHLRNLLIAGSTGSTALIEAADSVRERYEKESKTFSTANLLRLQRILGGTLNSIRWFSQPRFKIEADLVQMAEMSSAESVGELLSRLDELKKKVPDVGGGGTIDRRHTEAEQTRTERKEIQARTGRPEAQVQKSHSSDILDTNDVLAKWGDFISTFKQKRIAMGLTLEGTRILDVRGNLVRLACPDDFSLSSIKRYKRELQEVYGGLLNRNLQIEPELVEEESRKRLPEQATDQATEESLDDHPVVKALIRELGAEPL